MVLESEEGRDALIHVLTNVFQVPDDHPLSLSLKEHSIHDIQAIVDASEADIYALTYKDSQGSDVVDLPMNHKYMILLLKSYHRQACSAWGNHIGNDWKSLTVRDFDDFAEQIGFEPTSLRQVPSTQSTTPIKPTEESIALKTPSKASIAPKTPSKASTALKAAFKESSALETPPKASIAPKTPSKAPIILATPSKASTVLETSSKACFHTQVITPELMPEPSTPFSSILLRHASKAAAQIITAAISQPTHGCDDIW